MELTTLQITYISIFCFVCLSFIFIYYASMSEHRDFIAMMKDTSVRKDGEDLSYLMPRLCDPWKLALISSFPSLAGYFGYNNKLSGRFCTLLYILKPEVTRYTMYRAVWYAETMPELPFNDPTDTTKPSIMSLVYYQSITPPDIVDINLLRKKIDPARSKPSHTLSYINTAMMGVMLAMSFF